MRLACAGTGLIRCTLRQKDELRQVAAERAIVACLECLAAVGEAASQNIEQIDGASAWAVLAHLTDLAPGGVGPVLCDPGGPTTRLTFLVPPHTAAAWTEPHTAALGPACWLTIPGDEDHDRRDGLHRLTPPGGPSEHVDPDLLRQAITSRGAAS